jgi:hypothetical protein
VEWDQFMKKREGGKTMKNKKQNTRIQKIRLYSIHSESNSLQWAVLQCLSIGTSISEMIIVLNKYNILSIFKQLVFN